MVDAKCNLRESRGKPFPNSVCTLYCFHSHTHKKCINSPTRFPSSIPTVWGCPDVIFTWSRKPTARQRIYAPPPTTIICVLSSSAEAFFRARAHKSHITQRTTHTYIHTSGLKYKKKESLLTLEMYEALKHELIISELDGAPGQRRILSRAFTHHITSAGYTLPRDEEHARAAPRIYIFITWVFISYTRIIYTKMSGFCAALAPMFHAASGIY